MATKKAKSEVAANRIPVARLNSGEAIGGVCGPGRWLLFCYQPTSLFSLKMSAATSTVGKTLVVPTPYSFKMALLDASFRVPGSMGPEELVRTLAEAEVRIGVPEAAVLTHTIVKVRQEPKEAKEGVAYIPAVAYREFVHFKGQLVFGFDLVSMTVEGMEAVLRVAPAVQSIGKRGGFIQYLGASRVDEPGKRFTQAVASLSGALSMRMHLAMLDDFGPEANFDVMNSYSDKAIKRDKHRKFVQMVVPLGLRNTGPGFAEYSAEPM